MIDLIVAIQQAVDQTSQTVTQEQIDMGVIPDPSTTTSVPSPPPPSTDPGVVPSAPDSTPPVVPESSGGVSQGEAPTQEPEWMSGPNPDGNVIEVPVTPTMPPPALPAD